MHCQDPRFAQVIEFARTMRSKLLIDFAICEVDDFESSAAQLIRIFSKFQERDTNDLLMPDFEYCINDGVINVGRFTLSHYLTISLFHYSATKQC